MTWHYTLRFLALISGVWAQIESNDLQCCYLYGSVPRNESNCVPEGGQVSLNCLVYNPRDHFTNLTVKWFKSTESNAIASMNKYAIDISSHDEYYLSIFNSMTLSRNSTCGTLYGDTFSLIIMNFTSDKNGFYWCQIVINGSFLQPSQHVLLYADYSGSCEQRHYFRFAESAQCADTLYPATNVNPTLSTSISSTTILFNSSSTPTLYTISRDINQYLGCLRNSDMYLYIIGSLTGLILILGVAAIALLVPYVYRCQRKNFKTGKHKTVESNQKENCEAKKDSAKEENNAYQTLNVTELNYESMYAKIMPNH